ncbi:MAG: short chain dehydrogenase family protein, partial [Xanthomonadaceae bacterium]|nr:short chain dehydrogenase family protein [Xanthomonadaceae bacterium]
MDLQLGGKHALVCGGSEGIGRAAAHELALLGADVTLLARRADALQAAVTALPCAEGQRHGWIAADLADAHSLRSQIQALVSGRAVQILVNNTGGPPGGPVLSAEIPAFLDAFNTHLVANQIIVQA